MHQKLFLSVTKCLVHLVLKCSISANALSLTVSKTIFKCSFSSFGSSKMYSHKNIAPPVCSFSFILECVCCGCSEIELCIYFVVHTYVHMCNCEHTHFYSWVFKVAHTQVHTKIEMFSWRLMLCRDEKTGNW